MNDTKKLYIATVLGLCGGDVLVRIMDPSIPMLSLIVSNILAIVFLILYTNYKKRKYKKEELPDIDERVNENIKKYVNVSFIFAFLLLIVYIVASKAIGRITIPIPEIFIVCSFLFAGSLIIGVMAGKRA
ncbi:MULTISPECIES: hypothetical protein [Bacillus]|jgi:archaellum biogenesis protein FlaJ (TadC family)|uniref:Uncharacterized protein n=2 Tax=Bacillus cereus group TaxID=86661 RepID=R8HJC5_BACCE|nr:MULTISPECIES: hypothetical protein [Bacillus cereus group]EOO72955.1 hypothetical protein IIC_03843 [Bacillus cereus VD021]KIV75176.1 hypothetical protein SZ39_1497 [Bacillus mycoides]MCQ6527421.1 hypothetical protein [Bacillus mycoides]MCQ6565034.1 hypothetical protein [Bacillus mycoides]MDM5430441.1 hypothetical protein [Bacillus mycoides]